MWWKKKDYSVKPTGRSGIVYTEGERTLTIFSELLAGGDYDVVVYLSRAHHWDLPHEQEALLESDYTRIRGRVEQSLKMRIDWA